MRRAIQTLRSLVAVLLVALGLLIAGRGVLEGAPLTFTAMGALMVGLGVYRLRLLLRYGRQR
jgi:hypothetical protein